MSDPISAFGSTTDLVPVQAVLPEPPERPGSGAIVVMRDGSFRMLIRSGSVNFDMKDPLERQGLTQAFGMLINGLEKEFPLQIVSHSRILDVDAYVHQFDGRLANSQTPPKIKQLIESHQRHFERKVKKDRMQQREIYLVVPWLGVQGPLEASVIDEMPGSALIKKLSDRFTGDAEKRPSDREIATARQQLELRSDQVLAGLGRIGVTAHRLNEEELRRVLYTIFHPSLSERQRDPGIEGDFTGGFSAHRPPQGYLPEGGQF